MGLNRRHLMSCGALIEIGNICIECDVVVSKIVCLTWCIVSQLPTYCGRYVT
jgi:hypothetical protein